VLVILVVAVVIGVAAAHAGGRSQTIVLTPNGTRVGAVAKLSDRGVQLTIRGLPTGAPVLATIALYACSGGARVGYGYANGSGIAVWRARLPLTWAQLHDGRHVVSVASDGRTVACAAIPPSHAAPARHWGIWSFGLRFTH
jgi:hypothetical protein